MSRFNLLTEKIKKLNSREKILAIIVILSGVFVLIDQILTPISKSYSTNLVKLETLKGEIKNLPNMIEQYKLLAKQKSDIENIYKNSTLKDSSLSYLENLIKEKLEIDASRFQIRPAQTKPFGGSYEQEQVRLEIKVPSMSKLVLLLKELKNPENPLIVTRLELTRQAKNDFVNTIIEVSNIKPTL